MFFSTELSFVEELSKLKLGFTKRAVHEFSGTPNLGGKKLKLVAKDDARYVFTIRVKDVATGNVAMPFRHPEFARRYYASRDPVLYTQFEMVCAFARIRNHRLMQKCNVVIGQNEGKKQFEITQEMRDFDACLPQLVEKALTLGVNPYLYLDESTDDDDVTQCTNSWCLNQNAAATKASDNVIIITDLDGVEWLVLFERYNGPGRAQAAWAGGFVDPNETFAAAALREKSEEVEMDLPCDGVTFTTTVTVLPVIVSKDWDPRAKFVEGMENGATVTHYDFTPQDVFNPQD
jgi:hypothetical protein